MTSPVQLVASGVGGLVIGAVLMGLLLSGGDTGPVPPPSPSGPTAEAPVSACPPCPDVDCPEPEPCPACPDGPEPEPEPAPLDDEGGEPDEARWQALSEEVNRVSMIPWSALTPAEWATETEHLAKDLAWVDGLSCAFKNENRGPVLGLLWQLGRAAENAHPVRKVEEVRIGDQSFNRYYARFATDPSHMSVITDQEVYMEIEAIRPHLDEDVASGLCRDPFE